MAQVTQVSAGDQHTCVVTTDDGVRCWGVGGLGRLGYAAENNIGDDEVPADSGDVDVGADVLQVSSGVVHTCVLTTGNKVRCWGRGVAGQLGYGNIDTIGDDETPSTAGDVNVGADVVALDVGDDHTCGVTTGNTVRCWGFGDFGRLGYASTEIIGDNETPSDSGDVNVGAAVDQVSAGREHTCVVTTGNAVRCWGNGGDGRLGYAGTDNIGDDETPADSGEVDVGASVLEVSAGGWHTCARTATNTVRCWGRGLAGRLGYGNTDSIGDDEVPADAGDVDVGTTVSEISAGWDHTCVVTTGNTVRCWGDGADGKLGYGGTLAVGDNEAPSDAGDVNLGLPALHVSAGTSHTCAVTTSNTVRCWGDGTNGRLGRGNTADIGDNEVPADSGDVPVFPEAQLPVELTFFETLTEGNRVTLLWSTASETDNSGFEIHHLFERSGQTFFDVVDFVRGAGTANSPQSYRYEIEDLEVGRHRFRLKQIDHDGSFKYSGEVETTVEVPGTHVVGKAYPNPFNPRSYFSIAVSVAQDVTITLHDVAGRFVRTLYDGPVQANEQHWVTIDGADLSSGLYFYRIGGSNFTDSRSVILQK